MHGDRVTAAVTRSSWLLSRLPPVFPVGCYHRLRLSAPGIGLTPVLHAPSGAILALEHPQRPIAGLLFHPESLLSAHADPIVDNMLARKRAV